MQPHEDDPKLYLRCGELITGPFTRAQLLRLHGKGRLTEQHEVSYDRIVWRPVLSAPRPRPAPAPAPPEARAAPREEPPQTVYPAEAAPARPPAPPALPDDRRLEREVLGDRSRGRTSPGTWGPLLGCGLLTLALGVAIGVGGSLLLLSTRPAAEDGVTRGRGPGEGENAVERAKGDDKAPALPVVEAVTLKVEPHLVGEPIGFEVRVKVTGTPQAQRDFPWGLLEVTLDSSGVKPELTPDEKEQGRARASLKTSFPKSGRYQLRVALPKEVPGFDVKAGPAEAELVVASRPVKLGLALADRDPRAGDSPRLTLTGLPQDDLKAVARLRVEWKAEDGLLWGRVAPTRVKQAKEAGHEFTLGPLARRGYKVRAYFPADDPVYQGPAAEVTFIARPRRPRVEALPPDKEAFSRGRVSLPVQVLPERDTDAAPKGKARLLTEGHKSPLAEAELKDGKADLPVRGLAPKEYRLWVAFAPEKLDEEEPAGRDLGALRVVPSRLYPIDLRVMGTAPYRFRSPGEFEVNDTMPLPPGKYRIDFTPSPSKPKDVRIRVERTESDGNPALRVWWDRQGKDGKGLPNLRVLTLKFAEVRPGEWRPRYDLSDIHVLPRIEDKKQVDAAVKEMDKLRRALIGAEIAFFREGAPDGLPDARYTVDDASPSATWKRAPGP